MKCLKENKGKQLWEENKHTDEEKNVNKKERKSLEETVEYSQSNENKFVPDSEEEMFSDVNVQQTPTITAKFVVVEPTLETQPQEIMMEKINDENILLPDWIFYLYKAYFVQDIYLCIKNMWKQKEFYYFVQTKMWNIYKITFYKNIRIFSYC